MSNHKTAYYRLNQRHTSQRLRCSIYIVYSMYRTLMSVCSQARIQGGGGRTPPLSSTEYTFIYNFWIKYAPNCRKMHLKFQKLLGGMPSPPPGAHTCDERTASLSPTPHAPPPFPKSWIRAWQQPCWICLNFSSLYIQNVGNTTCRDIKKFLLPCFVLRKSLWHRLCPPLTSQWCTYPKASAGCQRSAPMT